jgi:spore coat polysaccharide biosynthesis protein SpsF
MRVVAIIQARMGSSRLPGKVLRKIGSRPVLAHVLERALSCRCLGRVVLATTEAPEDDAIIDTAVAFGVETFRGSRDDVLDRYYKAARAYEAEVVVRLTADCPLLDPTQTDRAVEHFLRHPELDYLGMGQSYPEGYGTEVFTVQALERTWREALLSSEREHVAAYMWMHPDQFKVTHLEYSEDLSRFRVTIDEEVDLRVVSAIVQALDSAGPLFGIDAVADFLKSHPEVAALNGGILRQAGYWKSVSADRSASESIKDR